MQTAIYLHDKAKTNAFMLATTITNYQNYQGCLRVELRYDTGFALQGRILKVLVIDRQRSFKAQGPSSTAAFGAPKEDGDSNM